MIYRYLSEIGSSYDDEVGQSGHREHALTSLENKLREAMLDLKKARDAEKSASGTSFQDRRQFFQDRANNANSAKIQELEAKVTRYRNWLVLQGAVVDNEGKINWDRTKRVVEYDNNYEKIGMTMIYFSGGRLFRDKLCRQPLDTKKMVTHFSGPGKAIYVMGRTGNIHVSSHIVGYRHHSSLLAGTNVAGAGELQVENGRLLWISNKSGHYAPSLVHLLQTLHQLQKNGVPMTFRVKLLPDNEEFATVGHLLDKMELAEQDYELAKLTRYMDYMDEDTLKQNGWRWRNEGERAGVYTIEGNVPVPHKQVRQWLKSRGFRAATEVQSGASR